MHLSVQQTRFKNFYGTTNRNFELSKGKTVAPLMVHSFFSSAKNSKQYGLQRIHYINEEHKLELSLST